MASTTSFRQSVKLYKCVSCKSEGKKTDAEYQCIDCEAKLCPACQDAHKKFPKLRDHDIQQLSSNPQICTNCKSGEVVPEASCFCKDCGEYLCNSCKSDHKKFKKLRGHIIVDIQKQEQKGDKSKQTGPCLADSKLQTTGPETTVLQSSPADGSRNDRGLRAPAPASESHLSAKNEDSPMSTSPCAHKKFPKLWDHEIQQLSSNPLVCTTCKSRDFDRVASCFCKDCDEYLCNICKGDHKKFKKLREHILTDVEKQKYSVDKGSHTCPAPADSKLKTCSPETTVLQTPPADESRNDKGLQASAPATESNLSARSEESPMSTSPKGSFNILNMSLKALNVVTLKMSDDDRVRIHDCAFMPSGDLLLTSQYKTEVIHLDSFFKVRERLELDTLQIAVLSENIAIGISNDKLHFLEVTPKLRISKSVPLSCLYSWSSRSLGMAAGGGLIYVLVFEENDDKGHIKVLDNEGKEIRRIDAVQNNQILFNKPYHLAASRTRLYITGLSAYETETNKTLTCLKPDGTLVYQYKDERLGVISSVVIDSEDNVLACAYGSKIKAEVKFHIIKANGKRHISKALEQSIEIPGLNSSDSLAFRPSDRTLVMGCFEELYIFKTA